MSGGERPDLPRDDALDAAWRAHSTELPPPHLDAAILASAHREAHARPHALGDDEALAEAREPSRAWWVLAAAATIGAIAFGIVHLAPVDAPTTPTAATDMPSVPSERTAPAPSGRIARDDRAKADVSNENPPGAQRTEPLPPAGERQAEGGASRAAPPQAAEPKAKQAMPAPRASASPSGKLVAPQDAAPAQAPEPSPPVLASVQPAAPPASASLPAPPPPVTLAVPQESASTGAGVISSQPRPFPGSSAPGATGDPAKRERATGEAAATPGEAPAPAAADARRRDETTRLQEARKSASAPTLRANIAPDAWVRRIVTLFEAGERTEAERELRAFRNAYPDADDRLPATLRAWAAGVKRD